MEEKKAKDLTGEEIASMVAESYQLIMVHQNRLGILQEELGKRKQAGKVEIIEKE